MIKRLTDDEASKFRKLNPETDFRYNMDQAVGFTLHPSEEEGCEDVTYYGEALLDTTGNAVKPSYVYVLLNKGFPGICKIGYTDKSVEDRCKSINAATGVIYPWYPVYSIKCLNGYSLEQDVHAYLEARGVRVNPRREGFEISSKQAIEIIEELNKNYI